MNEQEASKTKGKKYAGTLKANSIQENVGKEN